MGGCSGGGKIPLAPLASARCSWGRIRLRCQQHPCRMALPRLCARSQPVFFCHAPLWRASWRYVHNVVVHEAQHAPCPHQRDRLRRGRRPRAGYLPLAARPEKGFRPAQVAALVLARPLLRSLPLLAVRLHQICPQAQEVEGGVSARCSLGDLRCAPAPQDALPGYLALGSAHRHHRHRHAPVGGDLHQRHAAQVRLHRSTVPIDARRDDGQLVLRHPLGRHAMAARAPPLPDHASVQVQGAAPSAQGVG
mmetsp:Transcript_33841/g.72232  ORF Transcript_33841/g.72232 Transcript_33841/m.72232 type:complete len:250 (-) Transcript_33841:463-1212(-)